jgi:hypothetical protein
MTLYCVVNKGAVAAAILGGFTAIGAIAYFAAPGFFNGINGRPPDDDETNTASDGPVMQLFVLAGDEDNSPSIATYDANNTQPIQLEQDQHIRFDSPETRTAEGMRVTAKDFDTGDIVLLRKAYDVNNEFFASVDEGHYEILVQATWAEKGTFVYRFNVMIA